MSKYKVGDKVVIEITDKFKNAYGHEYYSILDSIYSTDFIDEKTEPLSTYTEPLERKNENKQKRIEKLVDRLHNQAAEITRLLRENNELKEQMKFDLPALISEEDKRRMDINKARAEGAEAAWELARKIVKMKLFDYKEIFNSQTLRTAINMTYPEAAAKVEVWEKAKEEIKVGDIVRAENIHGTDGIVTCVDGCNITLMLNNGVAVYRNKNACYKTGRHIDIEGLLKQIGEE